MTVRTGWTTQEAARFYNVFNCKPGPCFIAVFPIIIACGQQADRPAWPCLSDFFHSIMEFLALIYGKEMQFLIAWGNKRVFFVKFIYSEKTAKFCKIFTLLLTVVKRWRKVDWKGRALRLKSSLKAGRNFTQV